MLIEQVSVKDVYQPVMGASFFMEVWQNGQHVGSIQVSKLGYTTVSEWKRANPDWSAKLYQERFANVTPAKTWIDLFRKEQTDNPNLKPQHMAIQLKHKDDYLARQVLEQIGSEPSSELELRMLQNVW